jgi:MFS family permease
MPRHVFAHIKRRWYYALAPAKASEGLFSILFPLFLYDGLHLQIGAVGALTALISLMAVPGSMLWGALSDRQRRRRLYLVLGCSGSAVCLAGMGFAGNVWQMTLLCLAYGTFSIATAPVSSVLIMETTPHNHWEEAFGTFQKISGWGWVIGLGLGASLLPLLETWLPRALGLRALFLTMALTTMAAALWLWRTIPEPMHHMRRAQFVKVTGQLPHLTLIERVIYLPRRLLFVLHPSHLGRFRDYTRGPVGHYLWVTVAIFVSSNLVFTPLPLFMHEILHLPASYLFTFSMLRMLVSTLCYEPAGRWVHRIGLKQAQIWALGLRGLTFLALASLWIFPSRDRGVELGCLVMLNMFAGLTWSLIAVSGPTFVGSLTGPQHKGETMGIYNATQGVSRIIGAALSGYLAQWHGYYMVFALAGLLSLPGLALLVRFRLPVTSKTCI